MRKVIVGMLGSLVSAVAGCSGEPSSPAPTSAQGAVSSAAAQLLGDLRLRFVLTPAPLPADLPGLERQPSAPRALLAASQADSWEQADGWLRPRIADHHRRGITRPASVRLPLRASGAFEVTDDKSGMRLSVARVGASEAEAEQAEGWAMYRGGLGAGSDVLHRATAEGTEDFVHLAKKPEREELRYRVDVSAVAGLRLVSNVLEFVNAGGDPRLRLTAPMLVDGAGEPRELRIGVEGCAFSSDPAPPWGKAVVAPGASQCEVVVRWEAGASYPVVVDPAWTATGAMTSPRSRHSSSLLKDGTVLLVGGYTSVKKISTGAILPVTGGTSEIWNNGTFSPSGSLSNARNSHTATVLADGRVLIVGGSQANQSFEVWNNGTFATPPGVLTAPRQDHSATLLPDGRVLIVGGTQGQGTTSEIWSNGAVSAASSPLFFRSYHTATLLPDGRVLIVGGSVSPTTAEIWGGSGFVAAGTASIGFGGGDHSVLQADGRVLIVGAAGSKFWQAGAFTDAPVPLYYSQMSAVLSAGRLLLVGDSGIPAQLWNGTEFLLVSAMMAQRPRASATALSDGRALVTGGELAKNNPISIALLNSAEIWDESASDVGKTCGSGIQCSSGVCSDSICCATACLADETCVQSKTGLPQGQCG